MEEYADIYYVDSRNAVIREHRPGSGSPITHRPPGVSVGARPVAVPPSRTVYVPPAQAGGWAPATQPWAPAPPMYGQPPIWAGPPYQGTAASILGKLTTGQIVDMIAQVWAALQSLPAGPVATGEAGTDVGNLILYQGALAQHAKRDEQVRTVGSLVARLLG